jgi:glycosyltransferase involved in cell wall biosynthesis
VKVVYVTPRYGPEVVGGAEHGARMFAEHLAARGHDVQVLTTCARDHRTWANELPAGSSEVGGVAVERFPTATRRAADFDAYGAALLADPQAVSTAAADEWIRRQGPHSPALLDAVAAAEADVVAFYPYLYEPTVAGIARTTRPAVLHPAAHDEAPIHLPRFRAVFASARGLVLHTFAEQRLVDQLFPVAATPQVVLGLGVDPAGTDPDRARAALGLGDAPYLVCLGRVDDGKGTGVLARFFAAWRELHPEHPLRLVLAGPVLDRPPADPAVVVTGRVDDDTKWGLLAGATALVSPSGWESFSLVLLEAWLAGTPVLVNARCPATAEHVARCRGGLAYDGLAGFVAALDRLVGDPALATTLAARGRAYVERHYRWPSIIARYERFLAVVAGRA